LRPVARGARGEERSPAISEPNGLCRPSEYAATLDTAAALYVRMPEPDFGMSALSGSVEIGADDAADVGRRTPTGTRHARTRIARNAAPEVLVPRKTRGKTSGPIGTILRTALPHHGRAWVAAQVSPNRVS